MKLIKFESVGVVVWLPEDKVHSMELYLEQYMLYALPWHPSDSTGGVEYPLSEETAIDVLGQLESE